MADQDVANLKKRKLSTQDGTSQTSSASAGYSVPGPSMIPHISSSPSSLTAPVLYHLAVTAHKASHTHLQQAFIPSSVQYHHGKGYNPIEGSNGDGQLHSFRSDKIAAEKSLALLVYALDCLRAGMKRLSLSDREHAAWGLEFGKIAIKVLSLRQLRSLSTVKLQKEMIDKIGDDASDIVGHSLSIVRRHAYLAPLLLPLELASINLMVQQGHFGSARRAAKETLARCPSDALVFRFELLLFLLTHAESPADGLRILDVLEKTASSCGNHRMIELCQILRIRYLFQHRLWDSVATAMPQLTAAIAEDSKGTPNVDKGDPWPAYFALHCLIFQTLWEARKGNDDVVKGFLKRVYQEMDNLSDRGMSKTLRRFGGIFEFSFSQPSGYGKNTLRIQGTPLNIVYLLTFLTTVVSRRDYLGSSKSCKSLVLPASMQEFEDHARSEDMWDIGFGTCHSLADAMSFRSQVMQIRAEVLLEQSTALLFRSSSMEAAKVLDKVASHAFRENLLDTLAPHLCLSYGHLAHILGQEETASRYYQAASKLIKSGSELSLIVQACHLACKGSLGQLAENPKRREEVHQLALQCQKSSSANLSAVGSFLASLTDENRVSSKRKLSAAYDSTQKANNNVLRCLIFAFTTSVHLYGPADRTLRQLETGRDLARLMGGKEREDGVGQLALGLWFAQKLKEHHKREGNHAEYAKAKLLQQNHQRRLIELRGISNNANNVNAVV